MTSTLPDVLQEHSRLGAEGWQLQTMPDDRPARAVGLYKRGSERAWLVRHRDGFELQPVSEPPATVETEANG